MADFEFVDSGWKKLFSDASSVKNSTLSLICPFIQLQPIARLLNSESIKTIQVVTRLNAEDFLSGVSDTRALRLLLEVGGTVRCVKRLHTKMYIFGKETAFVTSANLTDTALSKNHEFGIVIKTERLVKECKRYFDGVWERAKVDLTFELLGRCEVEVSKAREKRGENARAPRLPDFGTDIGLPKEKEAGESDAPTPASEAYVKFFGTGSKRKNPSDTIIGEIKRSGSHWAGTYPKNKRPRQVKDKSVLFMACLVPNDILIYGRAVAMKYVEGRDDATSADIALRDWKKDWPHYIRVTDPEFLAGTLANGVSLRNLMNELGPDAFESTKRNAALGRGNVTPTKSIMRQPGVRLSTEGYEWVATRLSKNFLRFGRTSRQAIDQLDRPQF